MLIIFLLKFRNKKTWYRKIGESNTTNFWRHVEIHYPEKDPRQNKKTKKNNSRRSNYIYIILIGLLFKS